MPIRTDIFPDISVCATLVFGMGLHNYAVALSANMLYARYANKAFVFLM